MNRNHLIAGAIAAVAVAAGTAGAIAAGSRPDNAHEQAVLADAAKRLDVSAEELRSALAAAEDAQLDAAVKAGEITQGQADAIKAHRRAGGMVLGFGPGRPGGHHHRGRGGFGGGPAGGYGRGGWLIDDLATAVGIGREALIAQLHDGRTLAEIAKAEGKTLAQIRTAVKAAATARLDAALKAGRITKAQHDDMLDHLAHRIDHLGERPHFPGGHFPGGPRDARP